MRTRLSPNVPRHLTPDLATSAPNSASYIPSPAVLRRFDHKPLYPFYIHFCVFLSTFSLPHTARNTIMPADPKVKQQALSRELSEPPKDPGTFENIPRVRSIAGDLGDK